MFCEFFDFILTCKKIGFRLKNNYLLSYRTTKHTMKKILRDTSFRLSIILTLIFWGTGIAFYFFGLAELSWVLFLLLPIVLGLAIGALPNRRWAITGAILAGIVLLVGLFTFGLAGFICVIYSIPIIFPLMFLGSVITHLIDRYKTINTSRIHILLLPLLPFLVVAPIENELTKDTKDTVEVQTEKIFNYTPEQVYDAIKSVDTLDAEKPFLMHFGLPVPVKCVLEKEEVGGIRTCWLFSTFSGYGLLLDRKLGRNFAGWKWNNCLGWR
jgi:hypothetical protein